MNAWDTGLQTIKRGPRPSDMHRKRKTITPTFWEKTIIDLFYAQLMDYDVVKVKGFGIFLVDEKWPGNGRKTVRFRWWEIII